MLILRYFGGQSQSSGTQTPENIWVTLPAEATDARLAPYHADRSKLFVRENFSRMVRLDNPKWLLVP